MKKKGSWMPDWGWLAGAGFLWSGATALAARPEPADWFVGDLHVHRSCGGAPVSLAVISNAMVAADLMVLSLQADMGNGQVLDPVTDLPLVNGQDSPSSPPGRIIRWDAEWHWDPVYWQFPHQVIGGHILAMGITNAVQRWDEHTAPVLAWAREQGGVAGFAHLQFLPDRGFPEALDCCVPLEYPVEVALGNCDFISQDVAGGDPAMHAYYRLLNCGFRPGWGAGSDFPCNAEIGALTTFVQLDGPLTYSKWLAGLAAGRTVISRNGRAEFLNLKVNTNTIPGGTVHLPAGGGDVQISVDWSSSQPVSGTLEIVRNSVVEAGKTATLAANGMTNLSASLTFTNSGWVVARRMGGGGHRVHTAAVFVIVGNRPIRASASDAWFYVNWMDRLLGRTSPGGLWASYFTASRAEAHARYLAARDIFAQIASEASPLQITSDSLPAGVAGVPYAARATAFGGFAPYQWAVAGGQWPSGLTLDAASGRITGTPLSDGLHDFYLRVQDASAPPLVVTQAVQLLVSNLYPRLTLWPDDAWPGVLSAYDTNAVELGVMFRTDAPGKVLALRFFRGIGSPGPHVGNLWTADGSLLASVVFTNTSPWGWQEQPLPAPVSLQPDTGYVVSYHAPGGLYALTQYKLAGSGQTNQPLWAPRSGLFGGNGLHAYGPGGFPTNSYHASHYWVDLVFQPAVPNRPPSAPDLALSVEEDTAANFFLPGSDPDGPVEYALLAQTANGALSGLDTNTGAVTYTPAADFFGADEFSYLVSDGSLSATGTVSITVLPVNDPPVFAHAPPDATVAAGDTLAVTNSATDADTPANDLSYQLAGAPAGAAISPGGVITWTPGAGDVGVHWLVTVVGDGAATATNRFSVRVLPVLERPVILSIGVADESALIRWTAIPGYHYQVESTTNDLLTNWTALTGWIAATETNLSATNPAGGAPMQFYRIRAQ